jgi:putative transposase
VAAATALAEFADGPWGRKYPDSTLRRSVRTRGHFPSDEAATKLIWLQLREVTKNWKMPAREWHMAKSQFAVLFGDRFESNH